MSGSIICGVDGSPSAKGAARVARTLAGELRVGLVFVRVVDPDADEAQVSAIAERLERLSARASDVDCGAAWVVEVGHPADRLVAAANDAGATLIVVGSGGPRSSLLGSISADLTRRAPCPVVVVPPGADVRVNGRRNGRGAGSEADYAGGIVRLGLGRGRTEFAGGIARFELGVREPGG